MATSFDTFRLPQTGPYPQFIPYNGPPAPKPSSRRSSPKKASSITDEWHDIDEILGVGVESSTPFNRVEVVDLTCLGGRVNEKMGDDSNNGYGGGSYSQDELENIRSKESSSPRKVDIEKRSKDLDRAAIVEDSQVNAIDLNECQTESDPNLPHEDDQPPEEDHASTQANNQFRDSEMLAPECLGEECSSIRVEDVVDSEMVEGAGTQDDLLPCTNDSDKVMKPVRFGDQLSMPDTECRDTPKHRHVTTSQPMRGASGRTHLKAIAYQRQPLREKKANRRGEFTALENVSDSSHNDSDSSDDDDNYDDCVMSQTLLPSKRKRSPTDLIARKRRSRTSNTTSKQRFKHAIRPANQQKPSPFRSRLPLNDNLSISSDNSRNESHEENSDCRRLRSNERPKPTANSHKHKSKRGRGSVPPSRTNTKSTFLSSTLPSSYATVAVKPWPSTKSVLPRQANRQLPNIAIHPLPSNMAFMTALFRDYDEIGAFSSRRAVTLLASQVGHQAKLDSITVKPLAPGIWFLTCFTYCSSDTDGFPARQLNRGGDRRDQHGATLFGSTARGGVLSQVSDDQSGSDDIYRDGSPSEGENEEDDDHLRQDDDKSVTCEIGSRWSEKDDARLLRWKKAENKPWKWVFDQFPSRTPGAVRVRFHKLSHQEHGRPKVYSEGLDYCG